MDKHTFSTFFVNLTAAETLLGSADGKKKKYRLLNVLIHILDTTSEFSFGDLER